jgi:capsular exopolysaccharide synthesis family protein
VPYFEQKGTDTGLVTVAHPQSPASEAYRAIRTNVQFAGIDKPVHTIVITSPQAREGKSVTVSNLARSFADAGWMVTLVDTDLRHPSLQRIFGADRETGLSNLLLGESLNGHAAGPGSDDNLRLITSGPLPASPADVLGSERMAGLVGDLSHNSSYVLLDAPPVLGVSDAIQLSALVDGVILVVDPHRSNVKDIRDARDAIEAVGGRILGVVVNGVRTGDSLYPLARYGYRY